LFIIPPDFLENEEDQMNRKILIAFLILLVALFSFSCQKKAKIKGIELAVSFSEQNLTDNLITDVVYKWKIMPDFQKINQDYKVFVHFWHKTNMLFQDDYNPPVPTSKWEPGKEYTVTRRIYIPSFIDEFDPRFKGEDYLRLSVGLHNPFDRSGKSQVELFDKKLKVVPPPPDTPEVIYEDGWYDQEVNPDSYLKQWRWSKKEGRCVIDNPHRDALLCIKGGVNLEAVPNQKVIFKINDTVLDEFVPKESNFEKSYNIKKEMLGDKEDFILSISTDKTFIPAKVKLTSTDQRELGVQISFIYFR
jgi:hypothetical protein